MQLPARQKDTDRLDTDYSVLMPENSLHVIFYDTQRKGVQNLHILLPSLQHYKNFPL